MTDAIAQDQLRSFVERIENLESEIADLNSDKKDVYAKAKGSGFDTKILKRVIAERRKDSGERDEAETLFELYWQAVQSPSHVQAHAKDD